MHFKLWLEQTEVKRYVFLDFDGTLVHKQEVGWLKDHAKNKNYAKMLVPGKPPYKDVVTVKDDKEWHVFPRPGLSNFIKEVNKVGEVYVLTHSSGKYAEKAIKELGLDVKGIFHTGEQEPGSLGKKFDLSDCKWVLVDNLNTKSIEIINKMRILGLSYPSLKPKEEADRILSHEREHFIKVKEWIPTVDEYDDFELWKVIPKIKYLLGVSEALK